MLKGIKKPSKPHRLDKLRYAIYEDVIKGLNRIQVMKKLERNGYKTYGYDDTSEMSTNQKNLLWQKVMGMIKLSDEEIKEMRSLFFNRYEKLYQEALEANDRGVALNCLNSITKFAGLFEERVKLEQHSIIEVKFGFDNKKDEEEQ